MPSVSAAGFPGRCLPPSPETSLQGFHKASRNSRDDSTKGSQVSSIHRYGRPRPKGQASCPRASCHVWVRSAPGNPGPQPGSPELGAQLSPFRPQSHPHQGLTDSCSCPQSLWGKAGPGGVPCERLDPGAWCRSGHLNSGGSVGGWPFSANPGTEPFS